MMNEARRRSQSSRTSLRFVSLLPQMKQKPPGKHTGRMAPAEQAIGAAGTALGAGASVHPKSSDKVGYPDSKIKQIVILRRSVGVRNQRHLKKKAWSPE